MPFFELHRRYSIVVAMSPAGIVKKLDVIEDLCPGFVACFVDLALDSLRLQQREEAFSDGVVMAVTSATHAEFQSVVADELAPVGTGILHALI